MILTLGCGGESDTCGPGQVKQNGECVPAESIDFSDPSDPSDGNDPSDASNASDPTESSDASDPSESSDDSDPTNQTDPSDVIDCDDTLLIESDQLAPDLTPRLTLQLYCWDATAETVVAVSYKADDTEGAWVTLTNVSLEEVDPDKPWADYKLVGTVATDGTKRIIFLTRPEARSGELEVLSFNNDFSELTFASGVVTWGADDGAGCLETILIETPSIDDSSIVDIALRLDCWDVATGVPEGGAYTDAASEYVWQEFESISMDTVDPNMEWATYKLVAAMSDGTQVIVFLTDPSASSGQFQMIRFTSDFSEVLFDSGARTWLTEADPTDMADVTDPADPTDVTDVTDPSECGAPIELVTPTAGDSEVSDVALRLECWDDVTGSPSTGAYTTLAYDGEWQPFVTLSMEAVDADNTWATYKLVATVSDGSYRIVFFTDPTASSGQIQIISFNNDFSRVLFDTGYRFW